MKASRDGRHYRLAARWRIVFSSGLRRVLSHSGYRRPQTPHVIGNRFICGARRQQKMGIIRLGCATCRWLIHHEITTARLDGALELLHLFDQLQDVIG